MDLTFTLERLAIALGLGLLVGLQRERRRSRTAGIRTFALISLFGAVSAILANEFGGWIVAAGAIALAGLLIVTNLAKIRGGATDLGLTTEVAALLTFGVGAYVVVGHVAVAVMLGGSLALLLHYKAPMHKFVRRIGATDVTAIMRFVLIALVVLPALPNETYDPWGVLNPFKIWLMVVLIVAINLAGYVASKMLGQEKGVLVAGVLGGLVSSTATTVSFARQARTPENARIAALVIFIASTIVYARIMIEIAVAAPGASMSLLPPIACMLGWMIVVAVATYLLGHRDNVAMPAQKNPAELTTALVFAALYALVLVASAAAKTYFGNSGLYVVAFFSGLHDVDAITLSTANYVETDPESVSAAVGWRVILFASLVNLVVKAIYALALSGMTLGRSLALPFAAALLGGALLIFAWPVPETHGPEGPKLINGK